MPEIVIRPADSEDIEGLKEIEHDYQTDHVWQIERLMEEGQTIIHFRDVRLPRTVRLDFPYGLSLSDPNKLDISKVLVAVKDLEIVGYIHLDLQHTHRTARVIGLAVKKNYRRQGIAKTLLYAAQEWAVRSDIRRIMLEIQTKNYPAICMANKLGYEFCGYNDRYFANQDVALFFARYLR